MAGVSKYLIWRNRSLYLSTVPMPLREHTVPADQLVVCLAGDMRVRLDDGEEIVCRTVLLRAGTRVKMANVDGSNAVPAACYLNPVGQDYHAVKQSMSREADGIYYHHADEARLIEQLLYIRDHSLTPAEAYEMYDALIIPAAMRGQTFQEFDPRIITVLQRIKETVRDNLPMADLAAEVFLSESRLVKLFKAQIGVPITRYRLRYRLFVGVIYLSLGRSVTEAALASGFASTAHFSKSFSAMSGIQPTSTYFQPPFLDIVLSDDVMAMIRAREAG